MNKLPKVYSLCYSARVGCLCLLETAVDQEELDDIKQEKNFIHRLIMDAIQGLSSRPVPKMYLCKGTYTDFIWSQNGLLTFNQQVVDAFGGELEEYCELNPVECEQGPYYFYQVTHIIEAMDLSAISQIDPRYQSGEKYNSISTAKYEFIPENIVDALIFKDVNARPPCRVFLSERFIEVVKRIRFSGVGSKTFKPIWPRSEAYQEHSGPRVDLADLNL